MFLSILEVATPTDQALLATWWWIHNYLQLLLLPGGFGALILSSWVLLKVLSENATDSEIQLWRPLHQLLTGNETSAQHCTHVAHNLTYYSCIMLGDQTYQLLCQSNKRTRTWCFDHIYWEAHFTEASMQGVSWSYVQLCLSTHIPHHGYLIFNVSDCHTWDIT